MQSSVCRVAECLSTPGLRQESVAISFNFLYLKNIYPVVVWAVFFPSVLPFPTIFRWPSLL